MIPSLPRPAPWMEQAACAGSDPEGWATDNLPELPGERTRYAQRVCAGCPVIRQCAQWALAEPLTTGDYITGVVLAGMAHTDNSAKRGPCERVRRRMAERFDLPYIPKPGNGHHSGAPCLGCGRLTVPALRSPGPAQRRYAGHGYCTTCYNPAVRRTKDTEGQHE
ncbi:WhiB family transcriptional regulator [Nocardia brasiliensis]|uniref:WhiB family transcriptional regulator n=1 Tax=Nocardia brasiliensis TaxID=37326 RepID=UPI00142D8271|nr:WhiB family transcriptional regulator [Nocardia brasiliensis]